MDDIIWESATRQQLIQIALDEECSLCLKYEALRELQSRWNNGMLPDLVKLYAKGFNMSQIAYELGIDPHTVKNKLKQLGIYKRRVGA
ncbi:hypothetical protein H4O14_02275 [Bacillus sp. PAMC26568]|nr:hypothetical protein H4O14_02275 [Bacillus sp. PAMC26568]